LEDNEEEDDEDNFSMEVLSDDEDRYRLADFEVEQVIYMLNFT